MAVGLPLKTTYANGDVYSAADVNDTNGTINLFQTSTLSRQAGKNILINGGMDIWQRGTSFTTNNAYTADRWYMSNTSGTGRTFTRQTTSDTTNLPNIQYCLRVQRDSGNTSATDITLSQSIETVNSIPFAGQPVTVSFYARAGANYSSASSNLTVQVRSGTGTDQNTASGFTGNSNFISQTATLTTTWKRFSYSATVSTTATELAVLFAYTAVGTAGAADYFEVTGVQLELGSYATTFSRAGGTIQGELAACQRYYQKSYDQSVAPATNGNENGEVQMYTTSGIANLAVYANVRFPVSMRTAPTVTIYALDGSTTKVTSIGGGATQAANSGQAVWIGENSYSMYQNSGGTITGSSLGFKWHHAASAEL